jgi:hypothetical protein
MTLFTIIGHVALHFPIAVANIRLHVHFDYENTHVRPPTQKRDSFACCVMDSKWHTKITAIVYENSLRKVRNQMM